MTDDEIDRLAEGLAELILGPTKKGPSDKVTDAIGLLLDVVANVDARVAALEQRPELRHVGVWRESRTYPEASIVTHAGSLWLCKAATQARPGQNDAWQLIVKSGNGDARKHVPTRIRA